MTPKKPVEYAMILVYGGIILLMPPFIWIFHKDVFVVGVPLSALYVFGVWLALVAGSFWLSRALPEDDA